jgi:hypothetical protein
MTEAAKKGKKSAAASKAEKGEPPNIEDLVEAVRQVVGANVNLAQIRKELANNNYNVNVTATAFLDSECLWGCFFVFSPFSPTILDVDR